MILPANGGLRLSHRRTAFVLALSSLAILVSCGPSSSRYLADTEEQIYLKVPRDWTEVDIADTDPDRIEDLTSQVTLVWRVAATPDGAPSLATVDANEPLALSAVYELSGQLNQQMSASLARLAASPVGFDPVLPSDETQGDLVEVISYRPLDFPGINGSRIVFRARAEASEDWSAVYDLSAAYDSQKFRLYVLQVGCSARCYELNESAITSVANSWLVKK